MAEEGSFDLLAAVVRPLEALEDVVEIAASKRCCSVSKASDNRLETRPVPRGRGFGEKERILEAPTRSVLPVETFEDGVTADAPVLLPLGGSG